MFQIGGAPDGCTADTRAPDQLVWMILLHLIGKVCKLRGVDKVAGATSRGVAEGCEHIPMANLTMRAVTDKKLAAEPTEARREPGLLTEPFRIADNNLKGIAITPDDKGGLLLAQVPPM